MSQDDLPGVEGEGVSSPSIPEVDKAAAEYVVERDKRMKLTPLEVKAKEALVEALHAHIPRDPEGITRYRCKPLGKMITLKPSKEKLSVKAEESDEPEVDVEVED